MLYAQLASGSYIGHFSDRKQELHMRADSERIWTSGRGSSSSSSFFSGVKIPMTGRTSETGRRTATALVGSWSSWDGDSTWVSTPLGVFSRLGLSSWPNRVVAPVL